jgi:phthalate 4,5-cis-dihydrodiol dehydrogenase
VARVRAVTGAWDPTRPTEGAYAALLWFDDGAYASLCYSGYGHFDSDEWSGWVGEMGTRKRPQDYGAARRKLARVQGPAEEARLKAAGTYGGPEYVAPDAAAPDAEPAQHQHFGTVIVFCEHGDLRPVPDGVWVYGDERREHHALPVPAVPRSEVIDELHAAVVGRAAPLHDGSWAGATVQVILALLQSAREQRDIELA